MLEFHAQKLSQQSERDQFVEIVASLDKAESCGKLLRPGDPINCCKNFSFCSCGDHEEPESSDLFLRSSFQILPEVLSLFKNEIVPELLGNLAGAFDLSPRGSEESWILLLYSADHQPRSPFYEIIAGILRISESKAVSYADTITECGRICALQTEFKELADQRQEEFSKHSIYSRVISKEQYNQEILAFTSLRTLINICNFPEIKQFVNRVLFSPSSTLANRINTEASLQSPLDSDTLLIVDLLILFDSVLWREFRELLKELFNHSLLSYDSRFRIQFSKRFASHYKRLYQIHLKEREPECSMIEFTPFLLMESSIVCALDQETNFLSDILDCILDTFKPCFSASTSYSLSLLLSHLQEFTSNGLILQEITPEFKKRFLHVFSLFHQIFEAQYLVEKVPTKHSHSIAPILAQVIQNIAHSFTVQDLPLILKYNDTKLRISLYRPLQWLVGAIVYQHCDEFHSFEDSFRILVQDCLYMHLSLANFESKLTSFTAFINYDEIESYFHRFNYESMYAQDWNLLKFAAHKSSIPISIDIVEILNSNQLRDILALIGRLISKTDHNLPRIYLMHALAEGPMTMNELLQRQPFFVCRNQHKQFDLFLQELAEIKQDKFYLKPSFFDQIDIFHCSLNYSNTRNSIVQNARKNGVNVFLNDIPSETRFCVQILSELEKKLASVCMDDCSDTICALLLRIRKQNPDYGQCIVDRLPRNSHTVKKAFSSSTRSSCCTS